MLRTLLARDEDATQTLRQEQHEGSKYFSENIKFSTRKTRQKRLTDDSVIGVGGHHALDAI